MEDSKPTVGGSKVDQVLFDPLPKEVLDVSDRIGLKRNVPESVAASFLKNRLPPKILKEELSDYSTYLFRDRQSKHATDPQSSQKRKKKISLIASQRKRLFKLNKGTDLKYSVFEEVNTIWSDYIGSIIDEMRAEADQLNLIRADFHGAHFAVSAARNPSLVGICGIVVQETKNTFKLIKEDDSLTVVPKDGTMFAFGHGQKLFKLNGNYLAQTPHQRSRIKIKARKPRDDI